MKTSKLVAGVLVTTIGFEELLSRCRPMHVPHVDREQPRPYGLYASGGIMATTSGSSFIQGPYSTDT